MSDSVHSSLVQIGPTQEEKNYFQSFVVALPMGLPFCPAFNRRIAEREEEHLCSLVALALSS